MEKRIEYRLEAGLANVEWRITLRMLAAVGSVAALVKLLWRAPRFRRDSYLMMA